MMAAEMRALMEGDERVSVKNFIGKEGENGE